MIVSQKVEHTNPNSRCNHQLLGDSGNVYNLANFSHLQLRPLEATFNQLAALPLAADHLQLLHLQQNNLAASGLHVAASRLNVAASGFNLGVPHTCGSSCGALKMIAVVSKLQDLIITSLSHKIETSIMTSNKTSYFIDTLYEDRAVYRHQSIQSKFYFSSFKKKREIFLFSIRTLR